VLVAEGEEIGGEELYPCMKKKKMKLLLIQYIMAYFRNHT